MENRNISGPWDPLSMEKRITTAKPIPMKKTEKKKKKRNNLRSNILLTKA